MDEFFDIMDVKNEFLKNLGPQYQNMYAPQQLDIALYMLNDFCNNINANGLILLRHVEQAPPRPPQYAQPQPGYVIPPGVYQQPQYPPQQMRVQSYPQRPMENPFNEYDERFNVQQQVAEMNQGLQQAQTRSQFMQQPQRVITPEVVQDVDLRAEKPKTFVDKIKEMRTPKKADNINPEE